jgi:hypothetical protein
MWLAPEQSHIPTHAHARFHLRQEVFPLAPTTLVWTTTLDYLLPRQPITVKTRVAYCDVTDRNHVAMCECKLTTGW